jgi:hypothetical protein
MKKVALIFFFSILLSVTARSQETITITTYYPAPYGVYRHLRLSPTDSAPNCDSNNRGTMYYADTEDTLKICTTLDGAYNLYSLREVAGYWTQSGSNLYPNDLTWNVGIGTDSPDYDLEIERSGGGDLSLHTTDTSITSGDDLGTIYFRGRDSSARTGAMIRAEADWWTWGSSTNDAPTRLQFFTQSSGTTNNLGTPRMVIDRDGEVGIGKDNPARPLHIKAVSDKNIRLEEDGSGTEYFDIGVDNDGDLNIYNSNTITLSIRDSNNSVGIGTDEPSARLDVVGDTNIRGTLTVDSPDYYNYYDGDEEIGIISEGYHAGGHFRHKGGGSEVWLARGESDPEKYGIKAYGEVAAGYFKSTRIGATSGEAFLGYGNDGVRGIGDSYGVYGRTEASTGYAGYFEGGEGVYINGDLEVTGTLSKGSGSFVQPHPFDPTKEINYVMFEGRNHRVFFDGIAKLDKGKAIIRVPPDFRLVSSEKRPLNVILTPFGPNNLYVKERSLEKIVIESTGGRDIEFGYLVIATRKGFEQSKPIQENTHFRPDKSDTLQEFEERFKINSGDSHYLRLLKNLERELLIQNGILTKEGKVNLELIKKLGWEYKKENKFVKSESD